MASMSKVGSTATTVRMSKGIVSVVYHSTEVVHVGTDGVVTLNTDGWKTVTTKARMNQAANQFDLPFSVYQEKGEWFVALHTAEKSFVKTLTFDGDSITFDPSEVTK